jgi:mRNA-degrading endonuclease RelE of RelBE toxin-antitoxin system
VSAETPWRLLVAGPAARGLDRVPEKAAAAIVETLHAIAANPRRLGKPLRNELAGYYSARRGGFRIVYWLDEQTRTVHVVRIEHRADVYRPR